MIDNPEYLAFRRGIIYEGNYQQLWALYPTPIISHALCDFIDKKSNYSLIFREDSFDTLSRIRRGRIYHYHEGTNIGTNWYDITISNGVYGRLIGLPHDGKFDYDASAEIAEPQNLKDVMGAMIEIGSSGFSLPWRVIGSERNIHGHVVFTIKSISFFGLIPELQAVLKTRDDVVLAESDRENVTKSVNGVIDTLSIQQPTSVIDSARECCKVILTKWCGIGFHGKDLGPIAKGLKETHLMLSSAANVINRFHSNGKSAERESKEKLDICISAPTMDDAEISIYLVGLIIRSIGWAKSS